MTSKKWNEPKGKKYQHPSDVDFVTIPHAINVAGGVADYIKTETEDARGRWNDNYYVKDGFYVIHKGSEHYIYKLRKSK